MPLPRELASLVARQSGVVTRAQAVRCGVPPTTVSRRVATGDWLRLHPSVFLVDGHAQTLETKVRAATLWSGGWATGASAAWWYGLHDRPGPPYEVVVPHTVRRRAPPLVLVHRRRRMAAADLTTRRSLRVVGAPLAVLQTAVSANRGSEVLDRALQRRIPLDDLVRCHRRNLGCTGSTDMYRLLRIAAEGGESDAERLLVAAMTAAGLTGWVTGHPFRGWRIDIAFPDAHVAIEVDGWAWHSDVERFRRDRRKGNDLVTGGWKLLRFTWHELNDDPLGCVRQIAEALS